jgi:hypothetical protein
MKFNIISKGSGKIILLEYNQNGVLQKIDFGVEAEENMVAFMAANMPITTQSLGEFKETFKNALRVVKGQYEKIAFDDFWDAYGYKEGGKDKTKKAWDGMDAAQQHLAFEYIKKYKQSLGGTSLCYPITYINQKRWIK